MESGCCSCFLFWLLFLGLSTTSSSMASASSASFTAISFSSRRRGFRGFLGVAARALVLVLRRGVVESSTGRIFEDRDFLFGEGFGVRLGIGAVSVGGSWLLIEGLIGDWESMEGGGLRLRRRMGEDFAFFFFFFWNLILKMRSSKYKCKWWESLQTLQRENLGISTWARVFF